MIGGYGVERGQGGFVAQCGWDWVEMGDGTMCSVEKTKQVQKPCVEIHLCLQNVSKMNILSRLALKSLIKFIQK